MKKDSKKTSKKKKDILNKLSNVDKTTKKLIKEEKSLDIEEPVTNKRKRKSNNEYEYVYLKPFDKDTMFESFVKSEVNKRKIKQEFVVQRLIKILGLDYETAVSRAYNMVYVTNKGVTITSERMDIWLKIIGIKSINYEIECEDLDDELT